MANKIEKLQRDLFWEGMMGKSKQHLVGWDEVCAPMANGYDTLGLRRIDFGGGL